LDDSNMPRAAPNQIDQPDVVAALAAANTPEAKVGMPLLHTSGVGREVFVS
jgi:hypothetical protein